MKKMILASGLVFALSACGSLSPQRAVYMAKQEYTVALVIARTYENFPRCGQTASKICSDEKVVAVLRKVDDSAVAVLDAAEEVVRTGKGDVPNAVKAAKEAVSTFVTVTKPLAGGN